MRRTDRLAFVAILVLALAIPTRAAAQAGGCERLVGSLAAQLDPVRGAWVGQGALGIGNAAPLVTILVDQALVPPTFGDHRMSGQELLTFSKFVPGSAPEEPPVPTGDAIVMNVVFSGVSLPVPFMSSYHATGSISGTGAYAAATGRVVIDGQAMVDVGMLPPRVWPFTWLAQVRGEICGVR